MPVPVVRQAQEIDCQKCRKIKVPVPKTKWVKECNPIYDEKCHTEYHQHCKEETRCHVIYQTICDNSGYQQVSKKKSRGLKGASCFPQAALRESAPPTLLSWNQVPSHPRYTMCTGAKGEVQQGASWNYWVRRAKSMLAVWAWPGSAERASSWWPVRRLSRHQPSKQIKWSITHSSSNILQAHGHDHGSSLDLSGGYAAPQVKCML